MISPGIFGLIGGMKLLKTFIKTILDMVFRPVERVIILHNHDPEYPEYLFANLYVRDYFLFLFPRGRFARLTWQKYVIDWRWSKLYPGRERGSYCDDLVEVSGDDEKQVIRLAKEKWPGARVFRVQNGGRWVDDWTTISASDLENTKRLVEIF